ncbi:MAG: SRPBCC domain-containing protein, partial [Planctomycetes bacterium]|nr:SRPBCC domain-containing protein [Planctomycetota bacterium]
EGLYETMGRFCGYLSKLKTPADPLQPRSKRELVCDAHFETPVDRVFSAFRDPVQLAAWWGPEGFTNTFHLFEFVEGGKWTLTMHGPDGRDYPNELSFVEIYPPYRLVIEHPTSPHFIAEFDLVPLDQGTRLVMHQVFDSDDECQRIAEYAGNGNSEMFERLRALLKT